MKIKVRTADGAIKFLDVSKAMLVQDFRKKVSEAVNIEPKKQRLLFKGKQMEDGCDLLDYRINVGDIIDVSERIALEEIEDANSKTESEPPKFKEESEPDPGTSTNGSGPPEDTSKMIDSLRELCPDLAQEIEEELEGKPLPCKKCKDKEDKRCKECGCTVCGGKDAAEKQLFCEQCQYVTHMWCLDPPLEVIPDDDWYCPDCKIDASEIVRAGELGNKFSKRSNKMPSRMNAHSKRDWGKGLATAGRTKECTIVPKNHFGAIPGIDVGMCWKYRIQVSEEGVHRPPVAGIAGRGEEGCQSLVLAGIFEDIDNHDEGYEFIYTGCGGRDLSGNKRVGKQSMDLVLEKWNLSIARNCDAPIDKKKGNKANDWKKGKPIRVIRSAKMKKHSKFAPEEGNRYDGLYKVVEYWPEKGPSGFLVWRFRLRRDDPSPAPWEPGAKKFECIIPDIEKEETKDKSENPAKKMKLDKYVVEKDVKKMIVADTRNKSLWKTCLEFVGDKKAWFDHMEETFGCVICQCLLEKPVTLPCSHNVCKGCLDRSFKAEIYTCPMCRHELGKTYEKTVNKECDAVIAKLFQK